MKNIKDITISIFAIIGFVAIVTGFNNLEQPQTTTPESHIWEMHLHQVGNAYFSINKVTGEVRTYEIINTPAERKAIRTGAGNELIYRSAEEVKN